MAFKFFTVPLQNLDIAKAEWNAFLRSHRVVAVNRRWVDQGPGSFWSIGVDYLESAAKVTTGQPGEKRAKVDYKEVLNPDEFALFAKLRDLRREISQTEAVPVYTIFTNEQLST